MRGTRRCRTIRSASPSPPRTSAPTPCRRQVARADADAEHHDHQQGRDAHGHADDEQGALGPVRRLDRSVGGERVWVIGGRCRSGAFGDRALSGEGGGDQGTPSSSAYCALSTVFQSIAHMNSSVLVIAGPDGVPVAGGGQSRDDRVLAEVGHLAGVGAPDHEVELADQVELLGLIPAEYSVPVILSSSGESVKPREVRNSVRGASAEHGERLVRGLRVDGVHRAPLGVLLAGTGVLLLDLVEDRWPGFSRPTVFATSSVCGRSGTALSS